MAIDTPVNSQITDAVTQANVKVLGDGPAMAMGVIYQSLAHSTGIMFENAVAAQQNQAVLAQAATTQGVMQIYSLGAGVDAAAVAKLTQADTPDNLTSLLTALRGFGSGSAQAEAVEAALAAIKALAPTPAAKPATAVRPATTTKSAPKSAPKSAKPRG